MYRVLLKCGCRSAHYCGLYRSPRTTVHVFLLLCAILMAVRDAAASPVSPSQKLNVLHHHHHHHPCPPPPPPVCPPPPPPPPCPPPPPPPPPPPIPPTPPACPPNVPVEAIACPEGSITEVTRPLNMDLYGNTYVGPTQHFGIHLFYNNSANGNVTDFVFEFGPGSHGEGDHWSNVSLHEFGGGIDEVVSGQLLACVEASHIANLTVVMQNRSQEIFETIEAMGGYKALGANCQYFTCSLKHYILATPKCTPCHFGYKANVSPNATQAMARYMLKNVSMNSHLLSVLHSAHSRDASRDMMGVFEVTAVHDLIELLDANGTLSGSQVNSSKKAIAASLNGLNPFMKPFVPLIPDDWGPFVDQLEHVGKIQDLPSALSSIFTESAPDLVKVYSPAYIAKIADYLIDELDEGQFYGIQSYVASQYYLVFPALVRIPILHALGANIKDDTEGETAPFTRCHEFYEDYFTSLKFNVSYNLKETKWSDREAACTVSLALKGLAETSRKGAICYSDSVYWIRMWFLIGIGFCSLALWLAIGLVVATYDRSVCGFKSRALVGVLLPLICVVVFPLLAYSFFEPAVGLYWNTVKLNHLYSILKLGDIVESVVADSVGKVQSTPAQTASLAFHVHDRHPYYSTTLPVRYQHNLTNATGNMNTTTNPVLASELVLGDSLLSVGVTRHAALMVGWDLPSLQTVQNVEALFRRSIPTGPPISSSPSSAPSSTVRPGTSPSVPPPVPSPPHNQTNHTRLGFLLRSGTGALGNQSNTTGSTNITQPWVNITQPIGPALPSIADFENMCSETLHKRNLFIPKTSSLDSTASSSFRDLPLKLKGLVFGGAVANILMLILWLAVGIRAGCCGGENKKGTQANTDQQNTRNRVNDQGPRAPLLPGTGSIQ